PPLAGAVVGAAAAGLAGAAVLVGGAACPQAASTEPIVRPKPRPTTDRRVRQREAWQRGIAYSIFNLYGHLFRRRSRHGRTSRVPGGPIIPTCPRAGQSGPLSSGLPILAAFHGPTTHSQLLDHRPHRPWQDDPVRSPARDDRHDRRPRDDRARARLDGPRA